MINCKRLYQKLSLHASRKIVVTALSLIMLAAFNVQAAPPQENMIQGEFVAPADSFPRVRYYDSNQITLNDRCPVRLVPLNPKMTPVYINGRPVGFC